MMKNELIENCQVLVNVNIHKTAKLSRQAFLERVKNVKYIRTGINSHYISFYITSIEEYGNLKRFYELVNLGTFDFEGTHHVFAVAIPNKLYDWFKSQKFGVIERQITHWLAASYFFEEEKRKILDRQIFPPLLEEIKKIVKQQYSTYTPPFSEEELEILQDEDYDYAISKNYHSQKQKYLDVCQKS